MRLARFALVTGVAALLIMDWRLALVSLLFMPLLLHAVGRFSAGSRPAWKEVQDPFPPVAS